MKMPENQKVPSHAELQKAGTTERRRSNRPPLVSVKEELVKEEDEVISGLRPEAIAIALMVIALLILTAFAI